MATPGLFLIGTPPELFFITLLSLNYALAYALVAVAFLVSFILFLAAIRQLLCWMCCRRGAKRRSQPCGCCRCMKTVFLSMGRLLCVNMFPALFKKHKTHSVHSSQTTRVFMVFLDRKVENDLVLVAAFCSIVYIIFGLSALMFIQYFPVHVEYSEECHEVDNNGRALFCYVRGSNSSPLLNCSMHSQIGIQLNCYAIAFPGFGIGIAAAFGFAKVAIMGITIFVRIAERVFTMTMKSSRKLQEWHHCRSNTCLLSIGLQICANITFIALSLAILAVMIAVTCCISLATLQNVHTRGSSSTLRRQFYIIYVVLAPLIFLSMVCIIIKLAFHCKQDEYTSLANKQRPPNPLDWDVESELSVAAELEKECATIEQAPTESHSDNDMTVMMPEGTQPANPISSTTSVTSTDDETQV